MPVVADEAAVPDRLQHLARCATCNFVNMLSRGQSRPCASHMTNTVHSVCSPARARPCAYLSSVVRKDHVFGHAADHCFLGVCQVFTILHTICQVFLTPG